MNMFIHPKCFCLATGAILLTGAAFAQSSFDSGSFGGSFEDSSTQPVQTAPAPSGDSFGGSFDDVTTATQPPTGPASGDNFGGSFDSAPPVPDVQPGQQEQPSQTAQDPAPGPEANDQAAQLLAFELRDFGVPPQQQLRQGQFHAPTPTDLPGGQLVTSQNLVSALQQGMQIVIVDVLGGQYTLPNAYSAPPMAEAGSFDDRIQQQTSQWLGQITGGQADMPIVIYCSDPMCWLSYNASLRAIAAGYTNVYWYRGGIQAWQMAGLPVDTGGY